MSIRTSSLAFTNVSNASYSAWVNEIYNSLIAFGWVQTSDTGQSTFGGTLTAPAGVSTWPDVGIFRMADSLQSTCPVFMRIDFGEGATTDGPSIKIQFCIGSTNGAGTLTGNVTTQVVMINTTAQATTRNCRCAGTTSSFRMQFFSNSLSNAGWTVAIERDLDSSGAEVSTGVNILTGNATGNGFTMTSQFLELAGGTGPVDTRWYAMVSAQASQGGGGVIGVGGVRTSLGTFRNPMKTMLVFARGDFTNDTTTTVTVYGASHTYLMLRPNVQGAMAVNLWNADCGIALLWE
jgi:hypothetical protein